MIKCLLCNKDFHKITATHLLKSHGISTKFYRDRFPGAELSSLEFKKKRSDFMRSDKNVFRNKHQSKELIEKIVSARKKNGSYNHSRAWAEQHSLQMRRKYKDLPRDYPLEFNWGLKWKTIRRDNKVCQLCLISDGDSFVKYGHHLAVHHIDYNKQNCSEENLTALCISCNSRVNGHREFWKDYFLTNLERRRNKLIVSYPLVLDFPKCKTFYFSPTMGYLKRYAESFSL